VSDKPTAPERIWITPSSISYSRFQCHKEQTGEKDIEYVRADLVTPPDDAALRDVLLRVVNSDYVRCSSLGCDDTGVTAHQIGEQEWEPEQCEFCYCEPRSLFNLKQAINNTINVTAADTQPLVDDEELAAIVERHKATTPSEWVNQGQVVVDENTIVVGDESYNWRFVAHVNSDTEEGAEATPVISKEQAVANAEFIAHAHQDIPRLISRVREAERERDLAVAHDRQPYPTAYAYEKVCAALNKTKAALAEKEARIAELEKKLNP
jgi:hypothetical protein